MAEIPASKSISARALMIQALSSRSIILHNLSTAKDTLDLQRILGEKDSVFIHCGDGGTTFRFFLAYAALRIQNCIIHAGKQMSQRPVRPLIKALNDLGASIECIITEGYPPVQVCDKKMNGQVVAIQSDMSSQFISALMLIGPYLQNGLKINLQGETVSASYIDMTAQMMQHFGIDVETNKHYILVQPGNYNGGEYFIESDWSAATFWLACCAIQKGSTLSIHGKLNNSFQGDNGMQQILSAAGLTFEIDEENLRARNSSESIQLESEYNLLATPDLAPVFICLTASLRQKVLFTGLQTLPLKESNRLLALQTELNKCGILCQNIDNHALLVDGKGLHAPMQSFCSHNDHRIIMGLSLLSLVLGEIELDETDSIQKSYPDFFVQLKKNGFEIII